MPDDVTPFARVLLDYMWSQRPPLNFSGLARHIGVSKATVSNWASGKTTPNRGTLELIAHKTGIPLSALYEALGAQSAPAEQQDVWSFIVDNIVGSGHYTGDEQQMILEALRRIQAEYEQQKQSGTSDDPDASDSGRLASAGLVAESREHYTV